MNLPDEAFDRLTSPELAEPPLINIGCGEDLTIVELADLIRRVVGYTGRFRFDNSKPDGTPRKLLSVERLREFGWSPHIDLEEGIQLAYRDYLARLAQKDALR
jgi:GDP-L-fucose synthase